MGIYNENGPYQINRFPEYVYPSSVTFVDRKSGKRARLLSDVKSGQEGHVDSDENLNAYLPNTPALLQTRKNLEKHPRFQEGITKSRDGGEFAVTDSGHGISLIYDSKFREVLVPTRSAPKIKITIIDTQQEHEIDLQEQLNTEELSWIKQGSSFLNGIALHPDGIHYILSTSQGFIAIERGSHRINHSMTFPLPMMIHSHMLIA